MKAGLPVDLRAVEVPGPGHGPLLGCAALGHQQRRRGGCHLGPAEFHAGHGDQDIRSGAADLRQGGQGFGAQLAVRLEPGNRLDLADLLGEQCPEHRILFGVIEGAVVVQVCLAQDCGSGPCRGQGGQGPEPTGGIPVVFIGFHDSPHLAFPLWC